MLNYVCHCGHAVQYILYQIKQNMPAASLNIYSKGMYTLCTCTYAMHNNTRNDPAEHKYQDNAVKQTIKNQNRKCSAAHMYAPIKSSSYRQLILQPVISDYGQLSCQT